MMIISFELCCIALLLPSCVSLILFWDCKYGEHFAANYFQLAIKCNFRYSEDDKNYPQQIIDALLGRSFAIETSRTDFNVSNNGDPTEFNCDDDPDETGISLVDFVKNRFDESTASRDTSIDDDADSESLCCTTLKTIRPKTLPSVLNNKLVTVVNHGEFSQTVTIEECSWVDVDWKLAR